MSTSAAENIDDITDEQPVKKDRSTSDLVEGFNNLNLMRQIGLMIALAASVAIGFAVVLWTQGEDYRPLYAGLDRLDSKEVIEILEANPPPVGSALAAEYSLNLAVQKAHINQSIVNRIALIRQSQNYS